MYVHLQLEKTTYEVTLDAIFYDAEQGLLLATAVCVNQSLVQITIRFESLSLHLCKKKILCLPPRRRLTYIAVFNHALGDSKRIMILTMQVE